MFIFFKKFFLENENLRVKIQNKLHYLQYNMYLQFHRSGHVNKYSRSTDSLDYLQCNI